MRRRLAAFLGVAVALVGVDRWTPESPQRPPRPSASASALGSFRVECELSRQRRIDPIVAPGKTGPHMHDFFGNESVVASSTYLSMRASTTNCSTSADRAGYWSPTLMAPDGERVRPERGVFYYRNRPVGYGPITPFPADFRMVAGGSFPNAYWTCDGESDAGLVERKRSIPNCGRDGKIKLHVFFPSCWDGERTDSANHRSHVAYGLGEDGHVVGTDPDRCPASHPVKIPQLDFRVLYDVSDGRQYELSSGGVVPHADFWNTWVQRDLNELVAECLGYAGTSCGLAEDDAAEPRR
jgi:hypothetical protein